MPDYFGKYPPADFHNHFNQELRDLHTRRGTKRSYIAPRGGAKSTWCTLAYVLRCALEKWEPYTLILSDSSEQADELLRHIRAELEDNDLLNTVYPDAAGIGPQWAGNRICLNNGALVGSMGSGKKVRGRRNRAERPSLIVFDDIQSNEDVDSPTLRDRAWKWATREVIPAGDERTNFLAVGSAIHREAVSVQLGKLAGWQGHTFPAVHQWPDKMEMWTEFERLATNLADDKREQTARAFYEKNKAAMDKGAVVYWPERFPILELMLRRAEVGANAFESEYQGVPGSLEGAEFPPECFDRDGFWFNDWPQDLVLKIQSLDPSKGASDKADYQAHVLAALSRFGTLYVDAELRREARWVERAIDLAQMWNPHELIAESNNTMGLMKPAADRYLQELKNAGRSVRLNYSERTQTVHKAIRIRRLNDYLRLGQLRVRNTPGGRLLVEQLRDWPNGDHDDGPDALATAVIHIEELVA